MMIDGSGKSFALVSTNEIVFGVLLFAVSFIFSLGLVSFVLVKLPPTYFQQNRASDFWRNQHPGVRVAGVFVKNLLGLVLLGLGILMSIPGVPGQGLLTILLGVMLLDFPGKRRIEQRILGQPRVFKTINALRHRFGKPPLQLH